MSIFLLLFAFVTGATLVLGVATLTQKNPTEARLLRLTGRAEPEGSDPRREAFASRRSDLAGEIFRRFARLTSKREVEAGIRLKLVRAGYRSESAVETYVGARLLLPLALLLVGCLASYVTGAEGLTKLGMLLAPPLAGYVGPSYRLDKRRKQRQLEVRQSLPDALDLLVVCLEAGLGLGAALARVAAEFVRRSPVLCEELRLVNAEMQAGKSGSEALRGLAERVDVQAVSSLVAMLVQTERFGTSVADALRVYTDSLRIERLQKAEESAQKASTKMIFPTLVFIFPATILVALGPALLNALKTLGQL